MSSTVPVKDPDPKDPAPNASAGDYRVLARSYRPRRFEDLIGQEAMIRVLRNAFATGRIAHAFMLTGVRGVGKTTTARLLARALNYSREGDDAPSMQLDPPGDHCQAIMASRHPDVLELDAASRTGVADMRELLDGARYAPVMSRFKIYIVDEVHMLSIAAFNALLKTLEEPPPHVKFIFATTEVRKVPVTVLSRCQRFGLGRLEIDSMTGWLREICGKEQAQITDDALYLIARAAEGSARDALSMLDQAILSQNAGDEINAEMIRLMLGMADRSRILELLRSVIGGDSRSALQQTEALLHAGADAHALLKDLLEAVSDLARAEALGAEWHFSGPPEWETAIREMASGMDAARISLLWRMALTGANDCILAPEPNIAASMIVLRLAASSALPGPDEAALAMESFRRIDAALKNFPGAHIVEMSRDSPER